ncbi:MAG: GTP pyrophosphokinase family protein [Lachnospiraceae bacterium]|nr:GTP pyrophosphokinase family protein [Lachnospiraceae bacterium]
MTESIYGKYKDTLDYIAQTLETRIKFYSDNYYRETGTKIMEHYICRIKSEESMREKCRRKGLPETTHSALCELKDSIGIRIVTGFVDDIYANIEYIRQFPDCEIIQEKDYIRHAKSNGYRSYHLILDMTVPGVDAAGNDPGHYYVEVQLRTIAMDSWASLEHQLKYKKDVDNTEIIVSELKRVADELASCDVSMQTIKDLIYKKK